MALENFNDTLYVKGLLIELAPEETTKSVDVDFGFGSKIFGVKVMVQDCKFGDYGEFTIHHPITDSELAKFGDTCYFPEGNQSIEVTVGKGGSEIPANLKYRITVNATDGNGRKVIFWLMLLR